MYCWPCGIIFSKLAFSTSLVAANQPSTSVAIAQAINTARLVLNPRRSSALPEWRSNSATVRTTGIASSSVEAAAMAWVLERWDQRARGAPPATPPGPAGARDHRRSQANVDLFPPRAGLGAAKHAPAQPEREHRVACAGHAEEAAVVRNGERLEAARVRIELQHEAALTGDVEVTGDRPDRVQVEEFRILGAIEPRL